MGILVMFGGRKLAKCKKLGYSLDLGEVDFVGGVGGSTPIFTNLKILRKKTSFFNLKVGFYEIGQEVLGWPLNLPHLPQPTTSTHMRTFGGRKAGCVHEPMQRCM